MRGGRVLVAMMLVAGGLTACGGDDPADTDAASSTVATADTTSPQPATTEPATTEPATTPASGDGADPAVLERLRTILVRAEDLPPEAGWIEEPESEGEADAEPTDCLGLAFDAVGVQDLDASDGAVQRSFSAPDAPAFLTFGAAVSDPMPDLDRLAELVADCDGATDPDGTTYIVVRQPQFELVEESVSFFLNADQAGSMFNLLFVMAQRDDVTVFSAATAVVGEAEPDVEVVVGMVQLMLDRI